MSKSGTWKKCRLGGDLKSAYYQPSSPFLPCAKFEKRETRIDSGKLGEFFYISSYFLRTVFLHVFFIFLSYFFVFPSYFFISPSYFFINFFFGNFLAWLRNRDRVSCLSFHFFAVFEQVCKVPLGISRFLEDTTL